jgi:hypothetical protein
MIRTLRITSIIAAILATVLLVLPAVYGVRSDPKIEELLKAPDALDSFTASKGQGPAKDEGQVSPLVKQAVDFARYLNPPPPPPSLLPPPIVAAASAEPAPTAPVSVKFDLVGTSYYASHPELSLALIDEPGKGLHWVRQGESISHLTIEKVSDGSITVRDGQSTSEMAVKVDEQWRNLVKGAASEAKPPAPAGAPTGRPPSTRGPDVAALRRGRSGTPAAARPRGIGAEANAPGKIGAKSDAIQPASPSSTVSPPPPRQAGGETGGTPAAKSGAALVTQTQPVPEPAPDKIREMPGEENAAANVLPPPPPTQKDLVHQRLMDEVKASRITPDEAVRMEQLAETLEQLEEIQKQKSAQPQGGANPPESNTPPDANQT